MENDKDSARNAGAERFRQSQKMEALGRVAGGMAHDINNILGAIEGYAALILAGLAKDDPIRPDVEEILKAEQRAAQIAKVADAAVVGSVLVDQIALALERNENVTDKVLSTAAALSKAVRLARVDG